MSESKLSGGGFEAVRHPDGQNKITLWTDARHIAIITIVLVVVTAVQCHLFIDQHGEPGRWVPSILYGALLWVWWGVFALLLWNVGHRWPTVWRISWVNVVFQIALGTVLAEWHLLLLHTAIHLLVLRSHYLAAVGYESLAAPGIERLSLEVLLYVAAWMACAAIYSQIERQKEAVQSAELKEQLSKAHFHALQMQLEPHFLLNTLNAITALVEDGSQQEAAEMLSHLNAILRSTLVRQAPEKVSLAKELVMVEHYLAIEQIRFADRLRVEMSVDPKALDSMIPCFLLQPIIENAVRHGIAPLKADGVIYASVERKGDILHFSVRDNGPGSQSKSNPGHGIGLRTTEDRLALFYPKNYELRSGDAESGGFEVLITIPYERALA
jgi:signal transduction histidine kinase